MFKKCVFIAALLGLASLTFSQKIKYEDSWGTQGFSISKSAVSGVSLTYSINEFSLAKAEINGETLTTLQLPGVFLPNDEGAPDLPGSSRYIAIPQGSKAKYVVSEMKKEVYQNIDMTPAPKIPWDSDSTPMEYKKNGEIYSTDAFYPLSPVILSEPSKIRGLDVVMLGITPFQYNPVTKELIVYRDLKVDVTFEGGNGHFGEDRLRNPEWDRILKNAVLNNAVLEDVVYKKISDSKADEFEYIIICPDNATFITYANQLKDFRTKQGIKTGVVTTTQIGGNTEAAIEAYINNAYNNWDTPPSAVLMMADWGAEGTSGTLYAPTYEPTAYPCVSDNFYADVDTSDGKALPEITFARMTAQTEAHLQTMVSKIINNETNPPTSTAFYNSPITALGWQTERWFQICSESVGGYMKNQLGKSPVRINEIYEGNPTVDPWSIATNTSQVISYFGPAGRGYIPATPQELGAWTGGDATDVANAINNGAFMLMHRDHGFYLGWGEPDFVSADIDLLTNTTPTFIFSMNCQSGAFDYPSEVFAEKFHRYTYNGQNSGALGVLVASETSYSFVNDAYTWGTFDYMWPDYMDDYGALPTNNDEFMPAFASVSGKYFLDYSSWPYNTVNKIDTNYLFHLHGDAYMVVYTEPPQNLTIDHQDIFDSDNVAYISADPGAKIALVANGEIIGTDTGTGSMTGITIVPQAVDTEVTLTVTKQNYFRHEQTIVVVVPNSGGNFTVSSSSIPFGYVTVGGSVTQQFTITNSHSTEYLIGDITTITGYSVEIASKDTKNSLHYVIPPSSSKVFDLIFQPTDEASYNGNITVTSSDTGNATSYIAVSGAGAYPNISLPSVASSSAEPEASVSDSFNITNTGVAGLNYSDIINAYVGFQIPGGTYHTNDFSTFPGTGYTNSNFTSSSGGALVTGGTTTGVLTSPEFSTLAAGGTVYLDFTQSFFFVTGSYVKVEYYTGTAWEQIYYANEATSAAQHIELPVKAANTQLRFTGYMTRSGNGANTVRATWLIDNIVVSSEVVPYSWLTITSPLSGTVVSGGSNAINYTCSSVGLGLGTYNANLTIESDDPDEPAKVLPVEFIVGSSIIPDTPSNVTTSIVESDLVIDWDVSADAVSYDVYSSDDPYGAFTFEANVSANQYTVPYTDAKKFYYIISKN